MRWALEQLTKGEWLVLQRYSERHQAEAARTRMSERVAIRELRVREKPIA